MQQPTQFQGSYRYADRPTLERALVRARAAFGEALDPERMWLRCFVTDGTMLTVHLQVPADESKRFAAADLFLILAHGALEGAVDAR